MPNTRHLKIWQCWHSYRSSLHPSYMSLTPGGARGADHGVGVAFSMDTFSPSMTNAMSCRSPSTAPATA